MPRHITLDDIMTLFIGFWRFRPWMLLGRLNKEEDEIVGGLEQLSLACGVCYHFAAIFYGARRGDRGCCVWLFPFIRYYV